MKRHILTVALIAGSVFISNNCFADLVEKCHAKGRAQLNRLIDHQYKLNCNGSEGRCFTEYTNGDMAIHLSGGDVWVHAVAPTPQDVPPTYIQDPGDPNGLIMIGSLNVELNPGQVIQ